MAIVNSVAMNIGVHVSFWTMFFSRYKLWKILKEMGIPDHLTYLLKNLFAGQEAAVRTGHGTTDWLVPNRKRSTSRLYIVTLLS